MNFPLTPGPPDRRPAGGGGSFSDAFDRAAATLRDAGSSAIRTAGSSLVGLSRDGGAPAARGEFSSVSFRPLGEGSEDFVNVILGGSGVGGGPGGGRVHDSPSLSGMRGGHDYGVRLAHP
jgi:hypothetical protein